MRVALIVDNPNRDLPGLVLLAVRLYQYGATCYLVPMNLQTREVWTLAPDFVLLNYLRKGGSQEFARHLLAAGIKVGVLDTEGGVLENLDAYARTMAEDASVRHSIACFCSWGTKLADHAVQKGWYLSDQIVVTGNPRFDFYTSPWQAAALKVSPHADMLPKPLVLINGNFPLANPAFVTPEREVSDLIRTYGFDEKEMLRKQQIQRETMIRMVEMTNRLAAHFRNVTFIYRPHPFEKAETYRELLDSRSNLHLVKMGTVDGWILRASAVIQRSCSTAIEASLAQVTALSPIWIPTAGTMQSAEAVSIPCQSETDLIDHLHRILNGGLEIPEGVHASLNQVIRDWFYRVDGCAHERVADCILRNLPRGDERKLSTLRKFAYRASGRSLKSVTAAALRKLWGLPDNWSFRKWAVVPTTVAARPPWEQSEKYFDADQVRTLVDAIQAFAPNGKEPPRKVAVRSAQERGDYHFGYRQGRSVTIFPE